MCERKETNICSNRTLQLALSIVIPDEVQISSVKTADVKAMSLVAKVLPELEEKSGNRWMRVIPISYQVIKTVNANDYFIKVSASFKPEQISFL